MNTEAPLESVFRPAFVLMTGRALGFVAAFTIPVVLARFFEQSEFGTYKQLFLVYATLYSVTQLGMAESLFYFLPAAPQLGGRYALNAIFVLLIAGASSLGVLWVAKSAIAGWLNNHALAEYFPLIGFYLLLMLASAVLEIVMTARKRHFHASVIYAFGDLTRAAFYIVPALVFGGLEWLLFGAVAFALLRFFVTLFYLQREYHGNLHLDAGLLKTQLAYAAPFSLYVLIEVAQTNLHLYVVSYHFDAATFAIYSVGCLTIPLVDFLTSSAGNVMMVGMREHLLKGENRSVLALWGDTTRKLVLVFAPLVGVLLVVAHELIVGLFTSRYAASVSVFMVWSLTILLSSLLTDSVLRVYSQIRFLMLLGLIKLLLLAVTINLFLSSFGLLGAVLVVLMTTGVAKILALAKIKTVMQCRLAEFLPWRSLAAIIAIAAAATLPALAIKSMFAASNLLWVLIIGSVYAVTYLALLWRYGILSRQEKNFIAVSVMSFLGRRRELT